MIVGVCADKGAPGVTTVAVALAAVWPGERVVLEADPSGADLPFRLRSASTGELLAPSPSIASLVASARLGPPTGGLLPFAQVSSLGVPVVVGELTAERFSRLRLMWPLIAQVAAGWAGTAIADLGHLVPGNAAVQVAKAARVVVLLVPNTVEGLFRMRERVVDLAGLLADRADTAPVPIRVVMTGDRPDRSRAFEDARKVLASIGSPVPVAGFIPRDPVAAALLWSGVMTKRLARSPLISAASSLAHTLLGDLPDLAGPVNAGTPGGPGSPAPVSQGGFPVGRVGSGVGLS